MHTRRRTRWRRRWRQNLLAVDVIRVLAVLTFGEWYYHRPVCVHLWPQLIVRPRYVIVQPMFVKLTVHPALHRVTAESSECDARPGMMLAARALCGREGRSSVQVWVD